MAQRRVGGAGGAGCASVASGSVLSVGRLQCNAS